MSTEPIELPPLPPKWSAPLSIACVCPILTGGSVAVPECPVHGGPFGREVVKLRAEARRLQGELDWFMNEADYDLRERYFAAKRAAGR